MTTYGPPQPVTVPPRCALCPPNWALSTSYVSTVIDGVPLCADHGRKIAMKRLNISESDLSMVARTDTEQTGTET